VDHQTSLSILQVLPTRLLTGSTLTCQVVHTPSAVYRLAYPTQLQFTACGVPQGSSLGPKIFITYSEEIDEVFFNHHCVADDTQAYVDVPQSQVGAVASRIQNCLEDVANWSGARRLKLNPGKTNVKWFGSSTLLHCLSPSITTVVVDQQTTALN